MANPLEWMKAVRDHPDRPAVAQRMVLDALALRMDWRTGRGFASTGTLAADADCSERTVRNATMWARRALMLAQTKRGHRRGDGTTRASEWRLALSTGTQVPVEMSTGTQVPVEASTGTDEISTGKPAGLNRQMGASQPAPTAPPSELESSELETSLSRISTGTGEPGGGAADDERENDDFGDDEDELNPDHVLLADAVPDADPLDVENAITTLQLRKHHGEIRTTVRAYLRKIIENGDARSLVDDAADQRRRDERALAQYGDPFGAPVLPHAAKGHQAGPWTPAPASDSRPEWCGSCDERTRMRDLDDGRVARCRSCHPAASVAAPALKVIMGEVTG